MNRLRKLLGMYVALAMLVSSTVGVAVGQSRTDGGTQLGDHTYFPDGRILNPDGSWGSELGDSQFGFDGGTKLGDDTYYPDGRIRYKDGTWGSELGDSSPHGKAMATKTPSKDSEEEGGDGGGGGGGCDGGGSGGGGGGGLGGMLGKMMESLLPLLMMMMMMQQNKNNQPPTPGALPTIPPTFTPLQRSTAVPLFTAVPSAAPSASRVAAANEETTAGQGSNAADTRASTEAALFPTLPPMQ